MKKLLTVVALVAGFSAVNANAAKLPPCYSESTLKSLYSQVQKEDAVKNQYGYDRIRIGGMEATGETSGNTNWCGAVVQIMNSSTSQVLDSYVVYGVTYQKGKVVVEVNNLSPFQ